jgi:putative oxidoreductase
MNNIGLLLLRIVFCGAMIYGHGLGKLNKLIAGNFKFSDPIGIGEAPTLFLAVFSEFIAPIFILIGFKSKFFSFFPAATMFVAAFVVHLSDPFSRMEKAILFLAVFVFFMISGPGKYSIDKFNS